MDANNNQNSDKKKSITLIPLDWQNYERRRSFMQSHASFMKQGWQSKVAFADRRYTDAPVSGEEIAKIIRKSKTDLVAIIDEQFECDAYLFSWLADFKKESEVHYACQRLRGSKSGTNLFLAIYSFLIRILLKIGKNKYRPGIAVFFRNQNVIDWIPQSDEFTLTEFLALARVDGHEIRETLISPRSRPSNPIHSRAVLSAIGSTLRFWWNSIMFPGAKWDSNNGDHKGPTKRASH